MTAPRACLIGWPAGHSRSPIIHKYWLSSFGIDGDYRIEAVKPEDFAAFVASLGERGYVGANVTLPHKEQALKVADADARARAVGAANTLWFDGGKLRATNTDVEGFVGNLDEASPGWDKATDEALVLGAGGAARAIVFGLIERGIKTVHLVNRTLPRAEELARQFGAGVKPAAWDQIAALLPRATLLVNTTSLGMKGQPPLDIDLGVLPASATVVEAVYIPLDTPLLVAARKRGLKTADGLGMLLHQAVRGFSLWFGKRPTVTPELRALVEVDLTKA
jgi:shikimate dehydrogenase